MYTGSRPHANPPSLVHSGHPPRIHFTIPAQEAPNAIFQNIEYWNLAARTPGGPISPTLGYIDPGTGYVIFGAGEWLFGVIAGAVALLGGRVLAVLRRHPGCPALLAALALAAFLHDAGGGPLHSTYPHRVVVLGFDGLSPRILEEGMASGRLPNFRRLADAGGYRPLATSIPAESPVAWSGIATGQNPGKHGLFDFITPDPATHQLTLTTSRIENGRPVPVSPALRFWDHATRNGVPAVVLFLPVTFPPEGATRQIAGMGVPDILGTEGTFSYYTSYPGESASQVGGRVYSVRRASTMDLVLEGPRVRQGQSAVQPVTVPVKVTLGPSRRAVLEWQGQRAELTVDRWSDWHEVKFRIGWFRSMHAILRFRLLETEPGFRLYVSPLQHDPRSPWFVLSQPRDYSRELANRIGLFSTLGMPMDTWAVSDRVLTSGALLEQVESNWTERRAALDFELDRLKAGLLVAYFEAPDVVQHMFWRYRDTTDPLYDKQAPAELRDAIDNSYARCDEVLGQVLGRVGPEDTVIALSDHGFTSFRRAVHVNSWLREHGYLRLREGVSEGRELYADVDWAHTRAYAAGFGSVYLNLRGREAQGIVEPGAAAAALVQEISGGLLAWEDRGNRVVRHVYATARVYHGPETGKAPNLVLGFTPGYRASWQTALGGAPDGLIEDNLQEWSGDHLVDPPTVPGILATNRRLGPGMPSLYDVAPTILRTLGLPDRTLREADFDGRPLW